VGESNRDAKGVDEEENMVVVFPFQTDLGV